MEATSAPRPHALRIPKPRRLLAALSDERLVEHVRKGDAAAFELLYERYSAGILGFCRHMLGSVSDAEDAVQHTFIAAHADIQRSGQRQLHVKAWLYTIARNRCLSMLRARREHLSDEPIELVSEGFTSDVEQREDLRALLADVRKLPDEQREALVLAEVGDLSHDDIGSVLGCEASKVKSLVFQARTSLIDRRVGREMPCEQIREELATLRGGALRRSHLKHHLEACPGCTEYREEVKRQRAMLALALPVVPSAALKAQVLGGIGIGGGGAATAGAAGGGAAGIGLAQASVAKFAVAAALVAGGAGTAAIAENGGVPVLHKSDSSQQSSSGGGTGQPGDSNGGGGASGAAAASVGGAGGSKTSTSGTTTTGSHRSESGTEHGFTPTKGASNGEAARQFAATRGKGKKKGLLKAHTKKAKAKGKAHKKAAKKKHVATPRVRTTPVPKAQTPQTTKTAPSKPTTTTPKSQPTTPTATQPAPAPTETQTQTAPAPTGGNGGGNGKAVDKALGTGKRVTTEVSG